MSLKIHIVYLDLAAQYWLLVWLTTLCCSFNRKTPFDYSMQSFLSSVVKDEECPCLVLLDRMNEAQRIHQKQNHLQPSAHVMRTPCHHLISAHSSKATPPSSDQSSNNNTSPSRESTASMSEGLNDQSEIISDSVNASKTTAFYSKLVNLTMKNTP